MGRGNERLIATVDISVVVPEPLIENMDADVSGSADGIAPSLTNEAWPVRVASMCGFRPGSGKGAGLVAASSPIHLSIVGLDIEVSTHARGSGVPLPHDEIISVKISNGGWYADTIADVCYCIHTFEFHGEIEFGTGRKPVFGKAVASANAFAKAYETLNMLWPDFGFDLEHMVAHSALVDGIKDTLEERRLGNSGSAIWWRLSNGISTVDSMHDIDKYLRKDWPSISLASVATILELPPKMDADEMIVEKSDSYDVTDMLVYNSRDSDLHAWVMRR